MKAVLLTGGAGFIGSHLAEALLKNGHNVIIIDNFNDYYDPTIKRNNILEIKKTLNNLQLEEGKLIIYEGDVRDQKFVENVFTEYKIDMVIHLAAMAGVRYSIEQPKYYVDVNVNGTLNLLEACRLHHINKFILASSSSLYGNNIKVPFSELDSVDQPISPYAATKKAGEVLCYTYYHLYDISCACLRFFTVYGPRQRPDLAIHKFTNLILQDKVIPFYGDGTTERDYTYIDDIIDGITKTIHWISKEDKKYDIFNLGESKTISLATMVKTIESNLGKKAKLNRLPMQPGDVQRTFADISKAKKILQYNPTTKFEYGIKQFIEWKLKNSK